MCINTICNIIDKFETDRQTGEDVCTRCGTIQSRQSPIDCTREKNFDQVQQTSVGEVTADSFFNTKFTLKKRGGRRDPHTAKRHRSIRAINNSLIPPEQRFIHKVIDTSRLLLTRILCQERLSEALDISNINTFIRERCIKLHQHKDVALHKNVGVVSVFFVKWFLDTKNPCSISSPSLR